MREETQRDVLTGRRDNQQPDREIGRQLQKQIPKTGSEIDQTKSHMDQQRYTEKQIDRQEEQTEKDRQNCGGVREADKRTEG